MQGCRAAVSHAHGSLRVPRPPVPSRREQFSPACSSQSSLSPYKGRRRPAALPAGVAVMPMAVEQHPGGSMCPYAVTASLSNAPVALLGPTRLGTTGN